ncbi:MAG TPA: anthranilate phosphoribosyltransferase [Acidimicrobiales bacterium]|nr:anthranilate phosphoribosyltransferase [Acidimicrobiales bacterium]
MTERRSFEGIGGWPRVLARLMAGDDLEADEAAVCLGEILEGRATPAQIAAFAVALRAKGESVEEISGLVSAMLDHAEVVPGVEADGLVDTCGTGGDRSGSINVSTLAALVAAGAGARVCKHGNRAASSDCGSADVLEALGVAIEIGPDAVARCLDQAGMAFCFAPRFHPALRHAGPVRRELGVPTVFNFLGPLANPARVRRQVIGVSDPAMAEKMMGVLVARGAVRALVVHGRDGLDELSTTGPSTVLDLDDGQVSTYEVDPVALGIAPVSAEALRGGDATKNASLVRRVLSGEHGAHRDIALLNGAAAIVVAGLVADIAGGLELAARSVDDGSAARVLERLVTASNAGVTASP